MEVNITNNVTGYLELIKNTCQKEKLVETYKLMKKYKISLIYFNNKICKTFNIMLKGNNNIEVGHFDISISTQGLMMYIGIDEKHMNGILINIGLSRLMIAMMILHLENEHKNGFCRKDQLLFIDTDASYNNGKSFWDNIGMSKCRFDYDNRDGIRALNKIDGAGCEKSITYAGLSMWALGVPMGNNEIIINKYNK
jgi:hypothetical protein